MSEVLLELKDLNVRYTVDKVVSRAVNGFDLRVEKGQTIGLVGETGAGKTTTALSILRLLPKYTSQTQGEILFEGRDLLKVSEAEMRGIRGKHISMIFQDPMTSLNPVFTVGSQIGDVIRLHEKNLSQKEIDQKVGEILEMVGIPASRMNEYPHQFSGGMKQRVVIAIAIACSPELLIADEPTTALDVTIQAQIIKMMKELKQKLNSSIILITHDLGLVASFCEKVAIVYAGRIVEFGALEDIFDKSLPHHPYTEGLFASIPDLKSKVKRLTPIKGLMPPPSELPEGCEFHPRCNKCQQVCTSGEVPVYENGEHKIRCHLYCEGRE